MKKISTFNKFAKLNEGEQLSLFGDDSLQERNRMIIELLEKGEEFKQVIGDLPIGLGQETKSRYPYNIPFFPAGLWNAEDIEVLVTEPYGKSVYGKSVSNNSIISFIKKYPNFAISDYYYMTVDDGHTLFSRLPTDEEEIHRDNLEEFSEEGNRFLMENPPKRLIILE